MTSAFYSFSSIRKLRAAQRRSKLLSVCLEQMSDTAVGLRARRQGDRKTSTQIRNKVTDIADELAATRRELKAVGIELSGTRIGNPLSDSRRHG